MATISSYWKIINPQRQQNYYASVDPTVPDSNLSSASSGYRPVFSGEEDDTWYAKVMRGPASRIQAYTQYDQMDNDVDVARGMDIIAEEMTPTDEQTRLPFLIQWETEDNADISDTTIVTVRAALRQFSKIQEIQKRKFGIARHLAKYGDCIFVKRSDTKKWKSIDIRNVLAIGVDEDDIPISYYIRELDDNDVSQSFQQTSIGLVSPLDASGMPTSGKVVKYPAASIVHFTNCDEMTSTMPFGVSLLKPIYRVFRQYTMLEDAIVIYRIVRAPERRVFYVDIGNMNPAQGKRYLENIKDEMRQRRTPYSSANGRDMVDGQYDLASMQEDFFFPVTAGGRGSKIETIPGGSEDFGSNLLRQFQQKMFRGMRIPSSYLGDTGGDAQQQQVSDGKVGIAYFEELRFANFIMRQQKYMNKVFDEHFKIYLKTVGIRVDTNLFTIELPPPENFALYKQAAIDAELLNGYNTIADDDTISSRVKKKRYLGWTDDEIQMNEVMLKEERGISDGDSIPPLQQIYDPIVYKNRKPIIKKIPKTLNSDDSGGSTPTDDFGSMDMGGATDVGDDAGGGATDVAANQSNNSGGSTDSNSAPEDISPPMKV